MTSLNVNAFCHFSILIFCLFSCPASSANLRLNYYSKICPNLESIVHGAVKAKFNQTFVTVPATIRLFFHDCFVQGCDASIMIASTPNNTAEKDNSDNLSLAGDGFDTVIKAKAAVDLIPVCRNKVSCADILALATRDAIGLVGGPKYEVELGRYDGLSSTARSVNGKLPKPSFNLKQLNDMFISKDLNQEDMIALSGAHTIGFSHCGRFSNRIYNFKPPVLVDPTLNKTYAKQLQLLCPPNVDPQVAINMDPNTPRIFDNMYYKNLQQSSGLFTSDQVLYLDPMSKPTADSFANTPKAFQDAFIVGITKLGRVGVKTAKNGNIRRDCSVFN